MKKITSFLIAAVLVLSFSAKSQTSNLDFENWQSNSKATNWSSSMNFNILSIASIDCEFGSKTTQAHTGTYAMELKPYTMDLTPYKAILALMGIELPITKMTIPPILQYGSTSTVSITLDMISTLMDLADMNFENIEDLMQLAEAFEGLISEGAVIHSEPTYVKAWVKSSVPDTMTLIAFTTAAVGGQTTVVQAGMATTTNSTNWSELSASLTTLVPSVTPARLCVVVVGGGISAQQTTSYFVDDVTVDATVDLANYRAADFKVYPNPASDFVRIELEGEYDINIYDVTGKKVVAQKKLQGTSEINTAALRAGVYMLEVMQGDRMQTRKIVIE
ncbi:T9SS type A sorting domain-containing protein [Bacteroidales bacterium OttesenSCG-928-E04]|nr:T9SS type A sorting domain-containing protein [Bacteroidales bacterium OttesenSCG-928-E04]